LTVAFAALSALSIAFIAHACRTYRALGLHRLHRAPHVELETLVRGLGNGTLLWALFQAAFLGSMVLMSISCIVVTASAFDALSLLLLGNAWGVQLSPSLEWVSSCAQRGGCEGQPAFEAVSNAGGKIVSLGYALTVAMTAPLALLDVSDAFQMVSYVLSLACMLQLIFKFTAIAMAQEGGGAQVMPPAFGWANSGLALEVSFWSWCISFAGPLWVEEKDVSTPLAKPLILAFGHRVVLDLMLGLSGAAAFPNMPATTLNILDAVAVHPACGVLTRACGIGFVVSSLAANIVDYAMVASRNLESHLGVTAANMLGIGLPFASGWLFFFGESFASLVNAASPLLNGMVQFVVPALLFLAYSRMDSDAGAHSSSLKVLGMSLKESTWRLCALLIALVISLLILLTYVLNARGHIHPRGSADYAN
jgi:hypothetical protein